jgi:hypothetical protein
MEIFGYGAFAIVDHNGDRFYRFNHSYGYKWHQYDFATGNLLQYELCETLENHYRALYNNKPATTEKNNEEVFDLIVEAIKNKTSFDSKPYQPNSSMRFQVVIEETYIDLVVINIKNEHSQSVARFTEKDVKIYFPEIYGLSSNFKFINNLLEKLSEAFETDKFNYRYSPIGAKCKGKIRITKMNFYLDEGRRGCVNEIIPFVNPLIITL